MVCSWTRATCTAQRSPGEMRTVPRRAVELLLRSHRNPKANHCRELCPMETQNCNEVRKFLHTSRTATAQYWFLGCEAGSYRQKRRSQSHIRWVSGTASPDQWYSFRATFVDTLPPFAPTRVRGFFSDPGYQSERIEHELSNRWHQQPLRHDGKHHPTCGITGWAINPVPAGF